MVTKEPYNFSSFSYHESNFSLIARETIRLLVDHQLISIAIQPRSISLQHICYSRCQVIAVTSLYCLLFWTSKNKDLKQISKSAANVVLALKFLWTSKFVFPLWRTKINNLIALRTTNQITEISAPWWLSLKQRQLVSPTTIVTCIEELHKVVFCEVRRWWISQETWASYAVSFNNFSILFC